MVAAPTKHLKQAGTLPRYPYVGRVEVLYQALYLISDKSYDSYPSHNRALPYVACAWVTSSQKIFGPVRFPREVKPTDRVYDLTSRPLLQSHHRTPQLQAQLANRSFFASSNPIFRHACQENRRPERQPTLSSAQGLLQINIRCVDFF